MSIPEERIDEFRAAFADCFACGLANPIGLRLDGFHRRSATEIGARFHPRPEHRGTVGSLHGGVIAAALDETCAWTTVLLADTLAVTATLDIRYRKPADTDRPLTLIGTLGEGSGRRLRVGARLLRDQDIVAEASGVFLATEPVSTLWPSGA